MVMMGRSMVKYFEGCGVESSTGKIRCVLVI